MGTFFTSDEHYGHSNIIKFCQRPFSNVDEMREQLIARHNERVKPTDQTFHLGDIFWRHVSVQQATDILKRLNGRHFLIWGNHDETAKKVMDQCFGAPKFEFAKDVHLFRENGVRIWLSHYAHRVYPDSHKGAFHLYGHTHNVLPDFRLSMDVGVDASVGMFAPWSLDEIVNIMEVRKRNLPPDEVQRDMDKNKWDKTGN